jgi:flagellar biogenesis protein FliO
VWKAEWLGERLVLSRSQQLGLLILFVLFVIFLLVRLRG